MEVMKQEFSGTMCNKTAFCVGFILVVAPSNCYCGKHEQGVESDVLQWLYSLSGSDWTVNSERNMLV